METLRIEGIELSGMNLVEASAGTGKTYTIAGLYLRLVVEQGLDPSAILVVTFTEAATAELRERIRSRLLEAQRAFESGETKDALTQTLLGRIEEPAQAARRLRLAVLGFDRAAIFTIHGFCQRALREAAFESGERFESEVLPDESELLQQVAEDFWRLEVQELPAPFLDYLRGLGMTPAKLLQRVRRHLNRPFLEVRGGEEWSLEGLEAVRSQLQEARARIARLWAEDGAEVGRLLRDAKALNQNRYRPTSVEKWLRNLSDWVAGGAEDVFDGLDHLATPSLLGAVKKGQTPPRHPLFDAVADYLLVLEAKGQGLHGSWSWLLRRLLDYANRELPRRKAEAGLLAYDDMLLRLYEALRGEGGEALAATLRQRYRAALIDEFQDTDPIQYDIFRRIHADSEQPLFLVGDPKQAIYSFRGADIFAYLAARRDARCRHTLLENWRSTPEVIAGINALFGATAAPFLFDGIDFAPAVAAKREQPRLTEQGVAEAPFRFWFLRGEETKKPLGKDAAKERLNQAVAAEIARLLAGARRGQVRIGEAPLEARQIAVLVRSHTQGEAVQQALRARGIHSVQRSQADVFASREAGELERVLRALAWPAREGLLRAALATEMLGLDGAALQALNDQEVLLEQEAEGCRELHRLWRERGFVVMFRRLLSERGVAERLLALVEGERRLTNLLHLGELLHLHDSTAHPGMEGLVKWLALRRQGGAEEAEAAQLRLESDESLVQIVTIHKSKGLQYPVVFCPFLWDGKLWNYECKKGKGEYLFHTEEGQGEATRTVLELGSPAFDADLPRAQQEELAENLRLLYVAITRAEQRCYLAWGHIKEAGSSPLGWLLHPQPLLEGDWVKEARDGLKELGALAVRQRLGRLVSQEPVAIGVEEVSADAGRLDAAAPEEAPPLLEARSFQGRIRPGGRITSFSALATHGAEAERPDYDALHGEGAEAEPLIAEAPPGEVVRDIFRFPRGSQAGSCLHAVFERIDFLGHTPEALHSVAEQALREFGFDVEWAPVVTAMVREALALPLDGQALRLNLVPNDRRLVELEFYYPLAALRDHELRRLLREWLGEEGPLAAAAARVRFYEVQGFMKGFIDLVFEQDGVFYLADYKSNWLGDRLEDYATERLPATIAKEGYFLQYLFYTLALHRYLQSRLADYDYDRHFGGCYYLFLRGMRVETGAGCGVFFDRPPRGVIAGLERLIGGGRAAL